MKKILSYFYENELRRFGFALLLGWILTNVFYFIINFSIDYSLEKSLHNREAEVKRLTFYNISQQSAGTFKEYTNCLDSIELAKQIDVTEHHNLFLYGDTTRSETKSWSSFSNFFFPYMTRTTFSGGKVVEQLMGYDLNKGDYRDRKFRIISAYDERILRTNGGETDKDRKDSNIEAVTYREEVQKDLSFAIQPILSEIQGSTAYKIRRYLNGFIQYLTIWLTFVGILIVLFFHLYPAIQARKGMNLVLAAGSENDMNQIENQVTSGSTYSKLQPFRIFHILSDYFRVRTEDGNIRANEDLKSQIEEVRIEQESSGGVMRYLIWVIPSIGFIGTVIGIAQALENSHTVISDGGQLQRQAAVQDITSYLGVAFDTTLIALFASILLFMLVQVSVRYEEAYITESLSRITKKFVSAKTVKLDEQVSNWEQVVEVISTELSEEDLKRKEVKQFLEYCKEQ